MCQSNMERYSWYFNRQTLKKTVHPPYFYVCTCKHFGPIIYCLIMIVVDDLIIKKSSSASGKVVSNVVNISKKDVDVVKLISSGVFG